MSRGVLGFSIRFTSESDKWIGFLRGHDLVASRGQTTAANRLILRYE